MEGVIIDDTDNQQNLQEVSFEAEEALQYVKMCACGALYEDSQKLENHKKICLREVFKFSKKNCPFLFSTHKALHEHQYTS